MKLHYKGKFKDESVLTSLSTLHPNSTMFREPEYKTFAFIISIASIILFAILILLTFKLTNVDLLKLGTPLMLGVFYLYFQPFLMNFFMRFVLKKMYIFSKI